MSHYTHLSIEEREKLYLMKGQGKSFREIARELKRSPSTITREYKRGGDSKHPYRPSQAQCRYRKRRKNCGRKRVLLNSDFREKIRQLIEQQHWSPEQIANRLKLENNTFQISWPTIYRAIWAGLLDPPSELKYQKKRYRFVSKLRKQGKPRKKNGTPRKQANYEIVHTIDERPKESTDRSEIGHYEADTVAGKKGGERLLTLVDRCSRITLMTRVASGEAAPTRDAIVSLIRQMPEGTVKTVTPDRGNEFAAYLEVEQAINDVTFYFPPPHAPWERGTNENTNGLIREYTPKGKDIAELTDAQIASIADNLNHRPRKCLNWKTPVEVHFKKVLHLT